MTTIAFDSKILAADTRYTDGPHVHGYMRKLQRLPQGEVLVCAGYTGLGFKLKDALIKKKKISEALTKKELSKIDALLINKDGQLEYLDEYYEGFLPVDSRFFALGSGEDIALAGMRYGLNAIEAVKLASKAHLTTNDLVDSYNIETQTFTLADFPEHS